uniref:Uncharacterized protein n=1 Tax=Tetranychus urticae TaxID=32264 RepID=T1K336_TETUR
MFWEEQKAETSNGSFYLYGAYYDDRWRGDPLPSVRPIVSQATYTYGWYSKWGNYKDRLLQPYVINCKVPRIKGFPKKTTPDSISLVESKCQKPRNNLRKRDVDLLFLCIEDALDSTNDIGRSSYGAVHVQEAFEYAYLSLNKACGPTSSIVDQTKSLIRRIIRVSDEVVEMRLRVKEKFPSPPTPLSLHHHNINHNHHLPHLKKPLPKNYGPFCENFNDSAISLAESYDEDGITSSSASTIASLLDWNMKDLISRGAIPFDLTLESEMKKSFFIGMLYSSITNNLHEFDMKYITDRNIYVIDRLINLSSDRSIHSSRWHRLIMCISSFSTFGKIIQFLFYHFILNSRMSSHNTNISGDKSDTRSYSQKPSRDDESLSASPGTQQMSQQPSSSKRKRTASEARKIW